MQNLTAIIEATYLRAPDVPAGNPAIPAGLRVKVYTETADEARALAAALPRSTGVRGGALVDHSTRPATEHGLVQIQVNLAPNGSNKGANETGVRRYRTLRKHLAKQGIAVQFDGTAFANSYATEADFEAALAG